MVAEVLGTTEIVRAYWDRGPTRPLCPVGLGKPDEAIVAVMNAPLSVAVDAIPAAG